MLPTIALKTARNVQSHLRDGDFLIAQTKWLIPRIWDCIIMEKKFSSKVIQGYECFLQVRNFI